MDNIRSKNILRALIESHIHVKIEVALRDQNIWFTMYCFDPAFREFSYSEYARQLFVKQFTKITESLGSTHYYLFDVLHREDGPAYVSVNGDEKYSIGGLTHSYSDKPAVIFYNGAKIWYWYGTVHRGGDKHAMETEDGDRCWMVNGQRHRAGGKPAMIYASGRCEYWQHGQLYREGDLPTVTYNGIMSWYTGSTASRMLHRKTGPAIIHPDGYTAYYVEGEQLTRAQFDANAPPLSTGHVYEGADDFYQSLYA